MRSIPTHMTNTPRTIYKKRTITPAGFTGRLMMSKLTLHDVSHNGRNSPVSNKPDLFVSSCMG